MQPPGRFVGERLSDESTASGAGEGQVQKYLAGRLSDAEAEAFEERLFTDDALAGEVERALEIRAATAPARAATATARPRRRAWLALAAAAGIAVVAAGIAWLPRPPPEPVFRGSEQRMGLRVEMDTDALRARWAPVAGAAGYEIQVFAKDGRVLYDVETKETAATLELETPVQAPDAPAFVEITALDELGQELQRSERLAL
jgi:anti-sigma factor RsiW